MPAYVALIHYTQKGIEAIKDSPPRLEAAKKMFEAAGGKILKFYLTLGRYDAIAIAEFPSDEAIAKVVLAGSSQGYIRTETLRAFTEEEYRAMVGSLP